MLERKLKDKNLIFEKITDMEDIMMKAEENSFSSVPFMEVENKFLDYVKAVDYINSYESI